MSALWFASLEGRGRSLCALVTLLTVSLAGCTTYVGRITTTQPSSQTTTQRAPRSVDTSGPVHARPIAQAIREGVAKWFSGAFDAQRNRYNGLIRQKRMEMKATGQKDYGEYISLFEHTDTI